VDLVNIVYALPWLFAARAIARRSEHSQTLRFRLIDLNLTPSTIAFWATAPRVRRALYPQLMESHDALAAEDSQLGSGNYAVPILQQSAALAPPALWYREPKILERVCIRH
jgi:hypothetical protein